MPRLLIVEDEPLMARALADNLRIEGYQAVICGSAAEALTEVALGGYALIVLDIMLPDMDGRSLLRRLRRAGNRTPVLMLTALGSERDTVRGLDAGADDYLAKPFGLAELLARVRALLRRLPSPDGLQCLQLGAVQVDFDAATARRPSGTASLTTRENDLLRVLASRPGQVLSRAELIDACWPDEPGSDRSVDTLVYRLRCKIEADPSRPRHLVTVHGRGYRLDR